MQPCLLCCSINLLFKTPNLSACACWQHPSQQFLRSRKVMGATPIHRNSDDFFGSNGCIWNEQSKWHSTCVHSLELCYPFGFEFRRNLTTWKFWSFVLDDSSRHKFGSVWGACRLLENWVNLRLWSFLSFFRALKLTPGVSMALLRKMWVRSKRMVGSSMWRQLSSTSSDGIIQVKKYTKPDNLNLHRDGRHTLVKGKSLHFF